MRPRRPSCPPLLLSLIALAVCVATALPAAAADAPEVTLKFANYLPPQSAYSKTCEDFIRDLEERSNGRIAVRYFAGGTLLKAPAMFKGVESGIADIGLSHILYTPGRMPVMEACELPVGSPTGWVSCQIINDFYNKFRPKEFDAVHPLWFHANPPAVLSTKTPVRSVEDLKGLTVRAPGRMGELMAELGAAPAPTPMMEAYDAISKGVIQGVLTGIDGLKSFRFAEVAKYTNTLNTVGLSYPFYVVMNKRAYAKIPEDLRPMFDTLCGEYRERFALMWNATSFVGEAFGKENGVEFIDSLENDPQIRAASDKVIANYVKTMVDKGYAESEVNGWIQFLRERSAYLVEMQKSLQIKTALGPKELRP